MRSTGEKTPPAAEIGDGDLADMGATCLSDAARIRTSHP
jgi:hypothetical protein